MQAFTHSRGPHGLQLLGLTRVQCSPCLRLLQDACNRALELPLPLQASSPCHHVCTAATWRASEKGRKGSQCVKQASGFLSSLLYVCPHVCGSPVSPNCFLPFPFLPLLTSSHTGGFSSSWALAPAPCFLHRLPPLFSVACNFFPLFWTKGESTFPCTDRLCLWLLMRS